MYKYKLIFNINYHKIYYYKYILTYYYFLAIFVKFLNFIVKFNLNYQYSFILSNLQTLFMKPFKSIYYFSSSLLLESEFF